MIWVRAPPHFWSSFPRFSSCWATLSSFFGAELLLVFRLEGINQAEQEKKHVEPWFKQPGVPLLFMKYWLFNQFNRDPLFHGLWNNPKCKCAVFHPQQIPLNTNNVPGPLFFRTLNMRFTAFHFLGWPWKIHLVTWSFQACRKDAKKIGCGPDLGQIGRGGISA